MEQISFLGKARVSKNKKGTRVIIRIEGNLNPPQEDFFKNHGKGVDVQVQITGY